MMAIQGAYSFYEFPTTPAALFELFILQKVLDSELLILQSQSIALFFETQLIMTNKPGCTGARQIEYVSIKGKIFARRKEKFLDKNIPMITMSIQGDIEMQHTILTPRASRMKPHPGTTEYEEDYEEPVHTATSALRYDRALPRQTTTHPPVVSGWNWKAFQVKCLQILAVALFFVLLLDTAGYTAWKAVSDHWTYGDYSTTHLTANFGHGGVSHVVAFMNGHYAEIIEIVGTNTVNVYAVKVSSSEQRVVTLKVEDVNGDGKRDLVVTVEGASERPTLLNTGKGFEWSVSR